MRSPLFPPATHHSDMKLRSSVFNLYRELPYDVFYLIVMHGLASGTADCFFVVKISHVCRRWRSLALETPTFWSRIPFQKRGNGRFEKQLAWLKRTGNALLDITLIGQAFANRKSRPKTTTRILSILRPHLPRWRSFRMLGMPVDAVQAFCDNLLNASAPNLQMLVVSVVREGGSRSNATWRFRTFQGGTPDLKTLALIGVRVDLSWVSQGNKIRRFMIQRDTFDVDAVVAASQLHRLIARSPNVENLAVDNGPSASLPQHPAEHENPDNAPHLVTSESLVRLHAPALWVEHLLTSTRMPNLQELPVGLTSDAIPTICRSNPFPNITALSFSEINNHTNRNTNKSFFPRMLSLLPCLKELGLYGINYGDDFWVHHLTYSCPRLEILKFFGSTITNMGIKDIVLGRIMAKLGGVSPLKEVWCGSTNARLSAWLRDYGVKLIGYK